MKQRDGAGRGRIHERAKSREDNAISLAESGDSVKSRPNQETRWFHEHAGDRAELRVKVANCFRYGS